ncbi:38391_t:CDS:1, partial [Gigaspora margarita]
PYQSYNNINIQAQYQHMTILIKQNFSEIKTKKIVQTRNSKRQYHGINNDTSNDKNTTQKEQSNNN